MADGKFVNSGTTTLATISELRTKAGADATYTITNLVMNGGQIDFNSPNLGYPGPAVTLQGALTVTNLSNAPLYNDASLDYGPNFAAYLAGAGSIQIVGYQNGTFQTTYTNAFNFSCATNTYTGTWNVTAGVLLGSGANALGTNSITVGTNGALETTYDINSSNASLVINGRCYLHQNDTFGSVTVAGTPLTNGTYSFAALNSAYPANFPASWTKQNGSFYSTGSGSLTVGAGATMPTNLINALAAYDAAIANDVASGIPNAKLTNAVGLNGTSAGPTLNFGPGTNATLEFILTGSPRVVGNSNDQYLASGPANSGSPSASSLRYSQWKQTYQLGFSDSANDYKFTPAVASPTIPEHIAYVWNAATLTMKMYVNGVLNGTTTGVGAGFVMPFGSGLLGDDAWAAELMIGTIYRVTGYTNMLSDATILSHGQAFAGGNPTTTSVTSSANPANYGTSVTFTATVVGGTAPSGTVCFFDGTTFLGSNGLNGASQATLTTNLPAGAHSIQAIYDGDATNSGSGSTYLDQTVNPLELTISNPAVTTKTYDGTTTATLTGTLSGVVSGDTVTLSASGTFASAGVGSGIAVSSTWTLGGAQAGNYTLTQPTGLAGAITAKALTVSGTTVTTKTYDGTTTATLTGTLNGVVSGDTVTLNGAGAFASAGAGSGIAVTPACTLGGAQAGNYTLTQPTGLTGTITAKGLTVTANNASKTYGQTLSFAGTEFTTSSLVAGDSVTSVTLTPDGAAAGTHNIVPSAATGTGLGNYSITYVPGTLTVSPVALTVSATPVTRAYSATNPVPAATYSGFVGSDTASVLSGAPALTYTDATNSPVGTYPITVTAGSLSAANYTLLCQRHLDRDPSRPHGDG